jgi:hypothetical protein
MLLLDAWSTSTLFWAIPLLFALHYAEETPQMARWTHRS